MAKICPKHDVKFDENQTCWCCDKAKKDEALAKSKSGVSEGPKSFSNPNA